MTAINRLREQGFSVWLAGGGRIAIKPKLPIDWRDWVMRNRTQLINELQRELSNRHKRAKVYRCIDCQHSKRSPYNPTGGLTGCHVRNDVPLMLAGTRSVPCSLFEAANDG